MRRHVLRRLRLAGAVGIAAPLAFAPIVGTVNHASADSAGIVPVAKFYPTVINSAYSKLDPNPYAYYVRPVLAWKQRLLYTLDAVNGAPSMVAVYDADSLKPKNPKGLRLSKVVQSYVVDSNNGHIVVAEGTAGSTLLQVVGPGKAAPTVVGTLKFSASSLGDPSQRIVGMAQAGSTSVFYLLSADIDPSGSALVAGTTRLSAVDIGAVSSGHARVLWSNQISGCRLPATAPASPPASLMAGIGYLNSAHAIYFGCSSQGALGIAKPPDPEGIGKVVVAGSSTKPTFDHFELFPRFADFTSGAPSEFDPTSGRFIIQENNSGAGTQLDGFQTGDDAYVGSIGIPQGDLFVAWGVDGVHGRFYAVANDSTGLLAVNTEPTPLEQGTAYPKYQYAPDVKEVNGQPPIPQGMEIQVDPKTSRLFLYYGGLPYLNVLHDTVPYFHEPPPPNPDANTLNRPEKAGVTGVQFSATAQGYGAVYRQVGGIGNLQYNVVPIGLYQKLLVGSGTRELDAAYLGKLSLDSAEASASAMADNRDQANTGSDLESAKVKWPYVPVTCVDFGGTPTSPTGPGVEVHCAQRNKQVSGSALGGGSTVTTFGKHAPSLGVASSSVSASAVLDPHKGVVTTVTSTVHGINLLAGAVKIGTLTTTVEAHAHGRPGTAATTFTRILQDVHLGSQTLCTAGCHTDVVAAAINAAFPGRMRVDFPQPDAALAKGSPGGYQALVKRRADQQVQEVQLNEQPADRVEVPGMVVTAYQDNYVPSRTIAYLGGVEAEAYYGIYLLGDDAGTSGGAPTQGTKNPSQGANGATSLLQRPGQGVGTSPIPTLATGQPSYASRIGHGLRVLANSIGRFFRVFGVWLLLLVPIYLSARRWALLSRSLFYGGPR